jgi:hypothetical protein
VTCLRAVLVGLGVATLVSACFLRSTGPSRHATGTCAGACDYYLACKHQRDQDARAACITECRDVFGDRRSIEAFEAMSCRDVIEYVDGPPAPQSAHLISPRL